VSRTEPRDALEQIRKIARAEGNAIEAQMKPAQDPDIVIVPRRDPITDADIKATPEFNAIRDLRRQHPDWGAEKFYKHIKKHALDWSDFDGTTIDASIALAFRKEDKNSGNLGRPNKKKKKGLNLNDLVIEFLDIAKPRYSLKYWRKKWYEYKQISGYIEINESEICGRIVSFLIKHNFYQDHDKYASLTAEMLFRMRACDFCGVPEAVEMPSMLFKGEDGFIEGTPLPNVICFNGKMVDIMRDARIKAGLTKLSHISQDLIEDFWSMDHVKYDYTTEYEGKMPLFQKFLDDTLDTDQQASLQEMFGVCVSDETRWERLWFLHGEGGTGKGVTTEILEALVGRHNICNVMIDKMNDDFRVHPITECKVNIMGDMPKFSYGALAGIEGMLKQATGKGGKIDVNTKYGALVRNVPIRSRFIFTTNQLPGFVDKSEGIWRRLIVIPYPDIPIPENKRDANLSEKIIRKELGAIMCWAVEGLSNVLLRGYPYEPESGLKQKNDLRADCNHEAQFLKDKQIQGGTGKVAVSDVYEEYKEWMKDNCYKPLGKTGFISNVCKVLRGVKCEYANYMAVRKQCFIGVYSDNLLLE
jgi:P4 family phage/plasmid primase-like protien